MTCLSLSSLWIEELEARALFWTTVWGFTQKELNSILLTSLFHPPFVTLYLVCLARNASNLRDAARRVQAKRMNAQACPSRRLHQPEQPSQNYMTTSYELVNHSWSG